MPGGPLGGYGDHRHVQSAADDAGDLAEWHSLVADRVVAGARHSLLDRQPVEPSGVEPMDGRPAVEPIAHVRRHALLTRDLDQARNEAVVAVTVDRRWQ